MSFNEQFLVHKLQMKNTLFSMKFLNSKPLDHEGKTLAQQGYTSLEAQTVQEAREACPPPVTRVPFLYLACGDKAVWTMTDQQFL